MHRSWPSEFAFLFGGSEMTRDKQMTEWFGPVSPMSEAPEAETIDRLRELGDDAAANELDAAARGFEARAFGIDSIVGGLFNRFIKTTHLCGFLPARGTDPLVPVTQVQPDESLRGAPLKITLDGLHIARYPGRGMHNLLFDFALQSQVPEETETRVFHYNAKFAARDGETVPVRNFPLFYGLVPSHEGITFGFQTINVSSGFDQGLLDFLGRDEFKRGLSLVGAFSPAVGQLSSMAASLAGWLGGQSKNAKVQEFRQGLDFTSNRLGGALSEGTYVVVQIPLENQHQWSWADWEIDPTLVRLVNRQAGGEALEYNHLMFGVRRMDG
jgi:hypothetical protein